VCFLHLIEAEYLLERLSEIVILEFSEFLFNLSEEDIDFTSAFLCLKLYCFCDFLNQTSNKHIIVLLLFFLQRISILQLPWIDPSSCWCESKSIIWNYPPSSRRTLLLSIVSSPWCASSLLSLAHSWVSLIAPVRLDGPCDLRKSHNESISLEKKTIRFLIK